MPSKAELLQKLNHAKQRFGLKSKTNMIRKRSPNLRVQVSNDTDEIIIIENRLMGDSRRTRRNMERNNILESKD